MRRVGGTKDIDLDVRIIVASNEGLWNAEKKGRFREDLFHRFNEFSIEVPPLRERKDDILLFANHFLMLTNKELGKNVKGFTLETEKVLKAYTWHGNLRELKNVIKRATLLTDSNYIEVYSLPFEISHFNKLQFDHSTEESDKPELPETSTLVPSETDDSTVPPSLNENNFKKAVYNAEFKIIMDAMAKVNFNKSEAARLLNIDRKTLYNKLKQYTDNL
ncbi:MAG TPA: helix-turn-helix domain-containing protein, partial [Chitinophagaceae bacterium]|nr:helix-turn-helix domain-containing protein [Chitinophagaceae bacterium]